jgi:hypothetical protein
MQHSTTTILMGSTRSSVREVDNRAGAPATFTAGLVCHLKSDDTISLAAADGSMLGVSLGRSLSDIARVAIARKGLAIPILLANGFTPTIGAQVQVSTTTGKAVSSGTSVNAVYVTSTLTAYDEDGTAITDGAALIDFPGGL